MTDKICIQCQKFINDNENYLTLIESDKGKVIKTNYCHKNCWIILMDSKSKVREAYGMLSGLKGFMIDRGMLQKEVVNI